MLFAIESETLKSDLTLSLWSLLFIFVDKPCFVLLVASPVMLISLGTHRTKEVGGSGKLWGLQTRDAASYGSS